MRNAGDIFRVFWRLGLTCFGGPMVHFVVFRRTFVQERRWLTEHQYAQLLTLCQFLPGPGSSKLGFSIGLLRGGWWGALAAFTAFTLPSATLLLLFGLALPFFSGPLGTAALHGLKLVALIVVADGLRAMVPALCPDLTRRAIAVLSCVTVLLLGQAWGQLPAIALGALAGLLFCRQVQVPGEGDWQLAFGYRLANTLFLVFTVLLLALPLAAAAGAGDAVRYANAFFRTGALAFGGGHVVLPLLKHAVVDPGWVSNADFLAGYGAAQAVPGPMFALSAYLGARLPGPYGGSAGALIATVATFLPGFLLVAGMLPYWRSLATHPGAARAIAGLTAAVVGLLGAAFYDPVLVSAVQSPWDVLGAAAGLTVLIRFRPNVLVIAGACVGACLILAWLRG